MTQTEIYDEIRSVFSEAMPEADFPFDILQSVGGNKKSLVVPCTSGTYEYTASGIAPKNVKTPIYVLAKKSLHLVCMSVYL